MGTTGGPRPYAVGAPTRAVAAWGVGMHRAKPYVWKLGGLARGEFPNIGTIRTCRSYHTLNRLLNQVKVSYAYVRAPTRTAYEYMYHFLKRKTSNFMKIFLPAMMIEHMAHLPGADGGYGT